MQECLSNNNNDNNNYNSDTNNNDNNVDNNKNDSYTTTQQRNVLCFCLTLRLSPATVLLRVCQHRVPAKHNFGKQTVSMETILCSRSAGTNQSSAGVLESGGLTRQDGRTHKHTNTRPSSCVITLAAWIAQAVLHLCGRRYMCYCGVSSNSCDCALQIAVFCAITLVRRWVWPRQVQARWNCA
ncbi:unnamed protein product [Polarella glacialis]|uniref:Uncharacterized protein n=1 Tax=Polarella glacialis TaxID=89957 RepID=A0A813KVC2_POLGL|nr:unnamed protein product [Polarella glacialis]